MTQNFIKVANCRIDLSKVVFYAAIIDKSNGDTSINFKFSDGNGPPINVVFENTEELSKQLRYIDNLMEVRQENDQARKSIKDFMRKNLN